MDIANAGETFTDLRIFILSIYLLSDNIFSSVKNHINNMTDSPYLQGNLSYVRNLIPERPA